jgi:uncharacterized coiled-coil protein SlyX
MASKKDPGKSSKQSGPGKQTPQSTAPQATTAREAVGKPAGVPEKPELNIPIGPRPPIPPIIFHIGPAISSISPPGAVVGSGNLTLSVFGSNFGQGSVVQWNQTRLTTTVISNTQLQAAVPAANLAATAQVSVAVANPDTPPAVSNVVTFNVIPDITAIISTLQQIPQNPALLLGQLQTYITIQQQQNDSLTAQVNADQNTISGLNSQIANQQATITNLQNQVTTLTGEVQAAQAQSASPVEVAQSFKSVIDAFQASDQGTASGIQSTVTNMNVQIKSLVNVQAATATSPAKATMIFPSPTALPDPNHLSTLNLSFGSIPNLRTTATPSSGSTSKAAQPAPTPTPASAGPAAATETAAGKGPASGAPSKPTGKPAK